jgi:hypothetical protein
MVRPHAGGDYVERTKRLNHFAARSVIANARTRGVGRVFLFVDQHGVIVAVQGPGEPSAIAQVCADLVRAYGTQEKKW